jgi:hypothetical protein
MAGGSMARIFKLMLRSSVGIKNMGILFGNRNKILQKVFKMIIEKNKISFRKASVNDIQTLIDYRIIFLTETYGSIPPEKESSLRVSLLEYFTRSLINNSFISWLCEYEDKPVGFSGLVIREQPGNFEVPNGKTGYILNMFTLKDFRKNGICRLLLEKLIDESRLLKLEKLELHATKEGESVYRQLGFTDPLDKPLEIIL